MEYVNITDNNDTATSIGFYSLLKEPFPYKFILSTFLSVFMIFNVLGNVCTCAVIARDKTMRTPTNCYLFNLAVTDLLLACFIPAELFLMWAPSWYPFDETRCQLHFVLWNCLSNCGILTITAFTVERYLVVSRPFLRQKLRKKSRVLIIILINWLIASAFSIPDVFYIDALTNDEGIYCYFTVSNLFKIFSVAEAFVFFVLPMTILVVLYVLIAMKLKQTNKMRSSPIYGNQERERAVKMLAAVTGLFMFCWAPYCVLRVVAIFPKSSIGEFDGAWKVLYYICLVNVYLSTVVNPIVYSLMSRKFRQAFKDLLKGSQRQRTHSFSPVTKTYYSASSSTKERMKSNHKT